MLAIVGERIARVKDGRSPQPPGGLVEVRAVVVVQDFYSLDGHRLRQLAGAMPVIAKTAYPPLRSLRGEWTPCHSPLFLNVIVIYSVPSDRSIRPLAYIKSCILND